MGAMSRPLDALRASVARLHELTRGLDDAQLTGPSYDRDWTIADVLSHLGSGAVIMQRGLADTLAGAETPEDFAPSVWDEWNAKTPRAQAVDGLVADETLVKRLEAVGEPDRARLAYRLGPTTLNFDRLVCMRLNEHAMHTWDIEVMSDPEAEIPSDATAIVVDNLGLIARFSGRPDGDAPDVVLRTTDPVRAFSLRLSGENVDLQARPDGDRPDLTLPAEAFCRLVYGRLDPDHTPPFEGDAALVEQLRVVFPGV
jgi:uncharacterized protein (TIGR03083 family)